MNAVRTFVLYPGGRHGNAVHNLNGRRCTREAWDMAHAGRETDCHLTRIKKRADGSELVRQSHCIRGIA